MRAFAISLAALVLTALAACTSSSSSQNNAGDGSIGCQNDPLAEVYTANDMKPGQSGMLKFVLVSASPSPPAVDTNNTWTIKVLDASGNPVRNANITAKPWMPRHNHGPSVVPTITPNPDGTYAVSYIDFFMSGLWQVTFTVSGTVSGGDGGTVDSVVYSFCVQG
jgi:hypothetical protein